MARGFSVMQQAGSDRWKATLETVAVKIGGFELGSRVYAVGRRIPNGEPIRVTMSERGGAPVYRAGLGQRSERVLPGGVIVFHGCARNPDGTYEAQRSVVASISSDKTIRVAHDVQASVLAPIRRDDGTWSQSAQIVDTARSVTTPDYDGVVAGVLSALSEEGPGRSGAVIRGIDPDGQAAAVMIHRAWNWENGRYLNPEESFDAFVDREYVRIDGLEHARLSGADFLGYVQSLSEIAWEVIPMRSVGYGSSAAQAAAEGNGLDPSAPYRMSAGSTTTGFAPSLACFADERNICDLAPLRGFVEPVMVAHIPTAHATPAYSYPWRPAPLEMPRPAYLARQNTASAEAAHEPEQSVHTAQAAMPSANAERNEVRKPRRRRRAAAEAEVPAAAAATDSHQAEEALEPFDVRAPMDLAATMATPDVEEDVVEERVEDRVVEAEVETSAPDQPLLVAEDSADIQEAAPDASDTDEEMISLDVFAAELNSLKEADRAAEASAKETSEEDMISLDTFAAELKALEEAEQTTPDFEIDGDDLEFLAAFEPDASEGAHSPRGP